MSKNNTIKNALVHGLYSSDIVLPSENQQEFDALLEGYREEYRPDGPSEEDAVFDLVCLEWKKRRLMTGLRDAYQKLRDFENELDGQTPGASTTGFYELLKNLTEKIAQENLEEVRPAKFDSKVTGAVVDFDRLRALTAELLILGTEAVIPVLKGVETLRANQIESAYQPDLLEKELKIQAEIDRRIEKALKRLIIIKEFKRLHAPKLVEVKPAAADKTKTIAPPSSKEC